MERQKAAPPFGKDKFVQEDNTYLLVEVLAQKLAKQNFSALASNSAGVEPTVECSLPLENTSKYLHSKIFCVAPPCAVR